MSAVTFTLPKIYPITDTSISGLSHAEQVRRLAHGGAAIIQLRDKSAASGDLYDSAVEAAKIARDHPDLKLIINDRVDIALAADAGGVHLGQDDLPPDRAREILGPDAIIGFSTHTIEQARQALTLPVDYIAIGPIFRTTTKSDHEPLVGLDGLRAVRQITGSFPLVAIGGIDSTNAGSVLAAGADSIAMISDLLGKPAEITERIRYFSKL